MTQFIIALEAKDGTLIDQHATGAKTATGAKAAATKAYLAQAEAVNGRIIVTFVDGEGEQDIAVRYPGEGWTVPATTPAPVEESRPYELNFQYAIGRAGCLKASEKFEAVPAEAEAVAFNRIKVLAQTRIILFYEIYDPASQSTIGEYYPATIRYKFTTYHRGRISGERGGSAFEASRGEARQHILTIYRSHCGGGDIACEDIATGEKFRIADPD